MGACESKPAQEVVEEVPPAEGPRLVLLLVVDQFGADQLDRIGPLFTGGFRYLLDHGVSFTEAHHAHALTETGPGHATLATGQYPRHHGIVSNWWIEEGSFESRWAIDDDTYDESPLELEAPALGDWIKESYPQSKVFSASGKDRAAILMGGLKADGAFWFDVDIGGFETSEYYNEPRWLEGFNGQRRLNEYFGQLWEPVQLAPEAIEQLQLETLDMGPLLPGFPHAIGRPRSAPDDGFYSGLRDSPWWDEYLGQFGQFIIEAEDLGGDAYPDLLALSFSALDYVGHDYGPHSREYVDVLLRLDQTLARLLEFVDERVGLENTVIGLSADHGVVDVPELRQSRGLEGARIGWQTIVCIEQVGLELAELHDVDSWLVAGPRLAPGLSQRTGLSRAELELETVRQLEQCPFVSAVWTSTELLQQVDESERERWLFANCYYPERSPDFLIQFDEYFMPAPTLTTTHGSVYPYDTRVPLVLTAPNIGVGSVDSRVYTVDMAPTLAALLGLPHWPEVDGRNLTPLLAAAGQPEADAAAAN